MIFPLSPKRSSKNSEPFGAPSLGGVLAGQKGAIRWSEMVEYQYA